MTHLLNAAISDSKKQAYRRAILTYADFSKLHFPTYPIFLNSLGVLAAFIASLYSRHYAPATLMTYMSALSYIHKLAGKADPTQLFVIKKLLAGAQKLSGKPDTRLPISPSILHKIVDATQFIVSSTYLRNILQRMFLLAFDAFLRIREITVHSRSRGESIVQLGDVTISNTGVLLIMSHFKHNTSGRPVTLSISHTNDGHCQVQAVSILEGSRPI